MFHPVDMDTQWIWKVTMDLHNCPFINNGSMWQQIKASKYSNTFSRHTVLTRITIVKDQNVKVHVRHIKNDIFSPHDLKF